ncbi:MAG TPA: nucleotide exchange factor GrpE [Natronosporangium sp.]|nr:nucleotide exchange factor GrpE [Natronosporangium sp.]
MRDKRRVRAEPGTGGSTGGTRASGPVGSGQPGGPSPAGGRPKKPASAPGGEAPAEAGAAAGPAQTSGPAGGGGPAGGDGPSAAAEPAAAEPAAAEPAAEPAAAEPAAPAAAEETVSALAAELEALRAEVEERTRDLQRVGAEYANYRKRVERDRERAGELAVAGVLSALLPVLDDFERAREHEELPEGVLAIADHLTTTLAKFGLSAFGEKGDPFDPNRHEAVAHQKSADVTEPTCVEILRRGYLMGDRLLRPAMVAVADPE